MPSSSSDLVQDKIVCPHCWHNFYGDHAFFISRHSELFGQDPVLRGVVNRRFAPFDVERYRDGYATDSKGWKMVERACPKCRLQLPLSLLSRRPKFVSVVGAPKSGKTYFLTAMLHYLRKDLAKYFDYTLDFGDSPDVELFIGYANRLFSATNPDELVFLKKTEEAGAEFYNEVKLDGTDVKLPKPFIFELRPIRPGPPTSHVDRECALVLYDNAGESFYFSRGQGEDDRPTQHLGESDAVLFAFDLLLDPAARRRLQSVSHDPQLSKAVDTSRQEDLLAAAIQRIRRHRRSASQQHLDTPLLVCVQKYDVWKSLIPHVSAYERNVQLIDHSSIHFFEERGVAGLDIEELNAISLLVRQLIFDICPEFVAQAEANFKQVRYFPVSALGGSPTLDESFLKVRPSDVRPFRVTDPTLWLLTKWNFIRRTVKTKDNPDILPIANVLSVTDETISVTSPNNPRRLTLDREYEGSSIVHPISGERIWIPRVMKDVNINPNQVSADERTKGKLKLDKQNLPGKKRWFRWR